MKHETASCPKQIGKQVDVAESGIVCRIWSHTLFKRVRGGGSLGHFLLSRCPLTHLNMAQSLSACDRRQTVPRYLRIPLWSQLLKEHIQVPKRYLYALPGYHRIRFPYHFLLIQQSDIVHTGSALLHRTIRSHLTPSIIQPKSHALHTLAITAHTRCRCIKSPGTHRSTLRRQTVENGISKRKSSACTNFM